MSEGGNEGKRPILTLSIPIIKAETETQTVGHLVSRSPESKSSIMEPEEQKMSIRRRRNLSKNRGQAARQREKTPEPGVMGIQGDIATSEDEDEQQPRNSRELEADCTYEEMKRLVEEKANVKDPVYDLDIDEVLEQRAQAANDRRRRSISPFAVQDLVKMQEAGRLERKGSFTDPNNKLLSANYIMGQYEEDSTRRRNSLTIESPRDRRSSLTPPTPTSSSPKEKASSPFFLPATPKKLEEIVYPDEIKDKTAEERPKNLRTPITKESVFTFDDKDIKPTNKTVFQKATETPVTINKSLSAKVPETQATAAYQQRAVETSAPTSKSTTLQKTPETPAPAVKPSIYSPEIPIQSGEVITKVVQVERTPSKKLSQENRPVVEIRERIVRTPSRKLSTDWQPLIPKQPPKITKEETKLPPVKPARSKSASRFGSKTSESEMSEDQQTIAAGSKRKVLPTPRRFMKNRSPRANRSQSVARVEELKVVDKTGSEITKTGKEIIELMQERARSLSIPKDDPRLPPEYKRHSKKLQTPNKTPVSRTSRGISCPKTIQIISDKEILSGIATKHVRKQEEPEHRPVKPRRQSSGYIDASQSEYTSSCYSSSPSENEYDFDLSDRTAELTRKLNLLSKELARREIKLDEMTPGDSIAKLNDEPRSIIRKRSSVDTKNGGVKKEKVKTIGDKKSKSTDEAKNKSKKSRWKLIANWQQFKEEQKIFYDKLISLRNRCISEFVLMIILFGLGGLMFKSLEGSFENAYKCGTRGVKRDFIDNLWRGSHYLREDDWKSMARKKLHEFEDQLHTAYEAGVTSYSGQRSWNFMNSFVYCMTLVTTIGYGHIYPKTFYGRVATIVYAIIGIPLFLIVLADFGKLFTRIIKFFWAFIRRFYYTRSCRKVRRTAPVQEVMKGLNIMYDVVRRPSQIFSEEDLHAGEHGDHPAVLEHHPSDVPPPLPPKPGQVAIVKDADEPDFDTPAPSVFEIDDEFNLPITVAIVILIVYIIIGAVVYNIWEEWGFFECFYFVFISMSTIGLGDFVPEHPIFMMCSILYLVFGLALTSMCINVVQEKLSDTFKKASAKLGATIGLKVAEEDGSLVPITPPVTENVPVHKSKSEIVKDEGKDKETDENDKKDS
ncbi:hypothetical protein O0L34_g6516 [Tuta absoluta]|nr:hypothetical protein O0L34_g6516 [Tuta absoluta]